jgi:hypothetical protein
MSAERTFWTAPMRREIEEGEGVLFKEKFFNWSSTLPIQMQQIASGKNVAGRCHPSSRFHRHVVPYVRYVFVHNVHATAATKEQEKIDVLQLHRPPVPTEEIVVDDGHSKFPLAVRSRALAVSPAFRPR